MLLSPVFRITLEDQALISRKGEGRGEEKREREKPKQTKIPTINYVGCNSISSLCWTRASLGLISSRRAALDSGWLCSCVAVHPDWYPLSYWSQSSKMLTPGHAYCSWADGTGKRYCHARQGWYLEVINWTDPQPDQQGSAELFCLPWILEFCGYTCS